jgi:sulfoacetaldehyde acetyltransferase
MTTEEAFVKVLQMHGIEHAFGIIGSAMMPVSDLFPKAGITFWDCAHETNAGLMCDGYIRATGKMAMAIAQNGPGVTGFVTPVKTAYWNHTPMLLITPQAANKTIGQGGFQEMEQMRLFADCVCYQEEVRDPSRIPEVLNRVIMKAWRGSAPAQMNIPRDMWTQVIDVELPQVVRFERPAGGEQAIAKAADLLSKARFPVILSGAGVVLSGAIPDLVKLAERLDAPVCSNYQHNDSFPGSHPLAVGPLGYNGSKAAMELIAKADVVLALGTRLNPFSTLPGYGIDYWPKNAEVIQVDINADRIGLTKKVTVGIEGDATKVARAILAQLSDDAGDAGREDRRNLVSLTKSRWAQELSSLDHEDDDPGTTWNEESRQRDAELMSPRQAWRAIQSALPKDAIISSDIGNNCAIGHERDDRLRPRQLAGHHHGHLPQLPVGCGKAQHDALVRQQFRRHRARPRYVLREDRRGLRRQGSGGEGPARPDRGACQGCRAPDEEWRNHLHRGAAQPGTGRAVPPRRHEEAGGCRRHQPRRHAPATGCSLSLWLRDLR